MDRTVNHPLHNGTSSTMPLRRRTSSLLAMACVTLLAACSNGNEANDARPAQPNGPSPIPSATTRTLVDRGTYSTSPTNLLLDPGFSFGAGEGGAGAFLAFYEANFASYEFDTTIDSRSPAGFGSAVANIKPANATDTSSRAVLMLSSFLGGEGPFTVRIWASKSDAAGNPVDLVTGEDGITVSVAEDDPTGAAYELQPVPSASRVSGGRTWTLLELRLPKALPYGGFFLVRTGRGGGQHLVAAPEVLADPLVAALGTRSLEAPNATLVSRAVTSAERSAIVRYRSLPPRLVAPRAPHRPSKLD